MAQWAIFWRAGDDPNDEWQFEGFIFAADFRGALDAWQLQEPTRTAGQLSIHQLSLGARIVTLPIRRGSQW